MISAAQIRAGRALLAWSQGHLAKVAKISAPTIIRMENRGPETSAAGNVDAVQKALERAGVEFGADGSVRLVEKRGKN